MGQEKVIALLEIAKIESVGFLNMHGMWNIALSRHEAAMVIFANLKAIEKAVKEKPKKKASLAYFFALVDWFRENKALVELEKDCEVSEATSKLVNQTILADQKQEATENAEAGETTGQKETEAAEDDLNAGW